MEWQRKRGDAMAFNTVYQQAVRWFCNLDGYRVTNEPEWVPLLSPLPMPELSEDDPAGVTCKDVEPLLWKMDSEESWTQSEALILLGNVMTSTPSVCKPILSALIQKCFVLLTGSVTQDPEAEYAFGTILLALSRDTEGSLILARKGVLQLLADQICCDTRAVVVRKKMAQAVVTTMKNLQDSDIRTEEKRKIFKQVEDAMPEDLSFVDSRVRETLRSCKQ